MLCLVLVFFVGGVHSLHCDVLIAGGSTAALATAITAAEISSSLQVCLAEPTDWPGGQMTSCGVPAIDFGSYNRFPANQPRSFRELIESLAGVGGKCWVSSTCYDPKDMLAWIAQRFANSPNLHLLDRTVVRSTVRHADGRIASVHLVQRSPRAGVEEWDSVLSETIEDWYSPVDSERHTKQWINVSARVYVDATELGDVMMTGRLDVGQGSEQPRENSSAYDDTCGQAATLTFFMEVLHSVPPRPDPAPPGGTAGGAPFLNTGCCCPGNATSSADGPGPCDYRGMWTYRRARGLAEGDSPWTAVNDGDVSQQNWGNPSGNDLDNAYLFLPLHQARASVSAANWTGGLNISALRMLEERAYGWFHFYAASFPAFVRDRLVLNREFPGTLTGLSKMPYLRDTRRAIGLGGFRLEHKHQTGTPLSKTGEHFHDAVAFGNYPSDDHNIKTCSTPKYMNSSSTAPFYIPLRALTHKDAENLLVAGKTMAATFYANAATRLHPCEWSSGVAAGAAAAMMVEHDVGSASLLHEHLPSLLRLLNSSKVGQPLVWAL